MKICIDIRSIFSKIKSGVPLYTENLIKELIKINKIQKRNEFLFFINSFKKQNIPDFLEKEKTVNFYIPNRILNVIGYFFSFPKIDRIIDADIFYSTHMDIFPLADEKKHILNIYDISFLYFPEFFSIKKRIWQKAQKIEKQIKYARKIITPSEFTKKTIIDFYKINENKIEVVYPGISDLYQKIENENDLKKFKESFGINFPFILSVGTIEPRKNYPEIIEALKLIKTKKRFSDYKLIIVGAIGWKYKNILKMASQKSVKNDIIFWGRGKDEELLYLYNLADLFIYPSFFEGFGFPPLEAQICGTPVIASNRSSLPEVLAKSALLVDPYKVYELADTICEILDNEKIRKNLIASGYQNSSKFKWNEAATKILKIIEENG
jgi:glycosyltransferase involved in cell wall biosynthesis